MKRPADQGPPPVDFRLLCEGFASQALVHMGKLQNPLTGETDRDLTWAKYFIDLLGLLETKTRGNLTDEESRLLATSLSTLRLTFVKESGVKESGVKESGARESGAGGTQQ
jgi:hypothetical protein